jgi:hypothetical protein
VEYTSNCLQRLPERAAGVFDGQVCAVKTIHDAQDELAFKMFQREAHTLQECSHRCVLVSASKCCRCLCCERRWSHPGRLCVQVSRFYVASLERSVTWYSYLELEVHACLLLIMRFTFVSHTPARYSHCCMQAYHWLRSPVPSYSSRRHTQRQMGTGAGVRKSEQGCGRGHPCCRSQHSTAALVGLAGRLQAARCSTSRVIIPLIQLTLSA